MQTRPEVGKNLHANGFLLVNAAVVLRPHVRPPKEGKAWRPFLEVVLEALADRAGQAPPTLVLWGKIAALLQAMPVTTQFPQAVAEHPYNLSFIKNKDMQQLFGPIPLLVATNFKEVKVGKSSRKVHYLPFSCGFSNSNKNNTTFHNQTAAEQHANSNQVVKK